MTNLEKRKIAYVKSGMAKASHFFALAILLWVIGLPLLFYFHAKSMTIGTLLSLLGIYFFIKAKKLNEKFRQKTVDLIVLPMIQTYFPDAAFYADGDSYEILDPYYKYGLFNYAEDRQIRNLLITHDSNELETLELRCVIHGKHSRTIFDGTLLSYWYDTGIRSTVKIVCSENNELTVFNHESAFIPKDCEETPLKIETGNIDFDKYFEVYSSDRHDAYYVLNPFVVEKLEQLRKQYGDYAIVLTPEKVYVSIDNTDLFVTTPDVIYDEDNPFETTIRQINNLMDTVNDIATAISKSTEKEIIY